MSMQFVYGKSGTGKSEYIYNQIKEKIKTDSKIYVITPEQFSFTAEKKLMQVTGGSSLSAEVLSFERMAYRIFNEVSGGVDLHLSPSAKAMIIQDLLTSKKDELKFLGNSKDNIDLVSRQITELKKHNIMPKDLEEILDGLEENQYLKTKIEDILAIYNIYNQTIDEKYIDTDDVLTLLSGKIQESESLKNSIIYIDEFVGFTTQEYKVVEELLKTAKEVVVTVCTDDLDIEKSTAEADVFYPNKETVEKLVKCASRAKERIEKPIFLDKTYRFKTKELEYLENNLYNTKIEIYKDKPENIKLFLAANPYSEVENIAHSILELVRTEGYRYNDISIITKNIDTYSSNIKVIFDKYKIPVFIDEKKELSANIFIKYVTSLLDIFAKNWSYESMFNYINDNQITFNSNMMALIG